MNIKFIFNGECRNYNQYGNHVFIQGEKIEITWDNDNDSDKLDTNDNCAIG